MIKVWLDADDARRLGLDRQVEVEEDALVLAARGWPLLFGPGDPAACSDGDLRVMSRLKAIVAQALDGMPADDLAARQERIRATGWWPLTIYQGPGELQVHVGGQLLVTIPMDILLSRDAFMDDVLMSYHAVDPADPEA